MQALKLNVEEQMKSAMVVDDSSYIRLKIKKALAGQADVNYEAENGDVAVRQYQLLLEKGSRPDIIFMDITMKQKNGVQAAKEILAMDPTAKIVMVSALSNKDLILECIKMGVADYLVKPFDDDKLISSFQSALDI